MEEKHKEIIELKHEPVMGYRTAFHIVLAVAALYLAIILLKTT